MSKFEFQTKIKNIAGKNIVHIPKSVSQKFSSRGIVMVRGSVNNIDFKTVLEPDGNGSHWFEVKNVFKDKVKVSIEQINQWVEPKLDKDIDKILKENKYVLSLWQDITPLSRWEWVRWINSAKLNETRVKRISTMISMLKSGKKKPCCFNSTACSYNSLSKNGILLKE